MTCLKIRLSIGPDVDGLGIGEGKKGLSLVRGVSDSETLVIWFDPSTFESLFGSSDLFRLLEHLLIHTSTFLYVFL